MSYLKYRDGRNHYCRAAQIRADGGVLNISESPDRIGVYLSISKDNKELMLKLTKEQWEALNDIRYDLEVKSPQEAVVDKMAEGEGKSDA